jgi:hypothetical protein
MLGIRDILTQAVTLSYSDHIENSVRTSMGTNIAL